MEFTPRLTVTKQNVRLLTAKTDRFKTVCLTLNLLMPLSKNPAENMVLASYLIHSSKKYNSLSRLNARLEELYGAALSGSIVKYGEAFRIALSVTCLNDSLALDDTGIVGPCVDLLLDALLHPFCAEDGFDEKQLKTEVRLTVEDIESELNDKRFYALSRMLEIMCADEPYGMTRKEMLAGVKSVTPKSMEKAWRELLKGATIQLNAVGNIDENELQEKLETAFQALPEREILPIETMFVETAEDVVEQTEEMPMNQSKLVLGLRSGMQDANDDFYATRIMVDVFGGGPYSRLFANVREKMSLCYYCSARLLRKKGIIVIQSGIEKENREKVLAEIQNQFEIMKAGKFTDEELEASKKAICDAYKGFGDTPEMMDSYYGTQLEGEIQTPDVVIQKFQAVTREDVIRVANRVTLDTIYMLSGTEEQDHA